jgi:hypothetical protein
MLLNLSEDVDVERKMVQKTDLIKCVIVVGCCCCCSCRGFPSSFGPGWHSVVVVVVVVVDGVVVVVIDKRSFTLCPTRWRLESRFCGRALSLSLSLSLSLPLKKAPRGSAGPQQPGAAQDRDGVPEEAVHRVGELPEGTYRN